VDIRKFFDTLDHAHLRELLRRRIRDGVLLRLIGKWLNAGVLEDGSISYPAQGTPQGGVISPLLANVFLHDVLDTWFEREVKPRLRSRAFLIRYADDFVMQVFDSANLHLPAPKQLMNSQNGRGTTRSFPECAAEVRP
jgi:retron-type reverse transcriptase